MGLYRYITNRKIAGARGEGNIKVLVKGGSDVAEVDYRCPECQHAEHQSKPWKRPFSINCSKCGCLLRIPKLKAKA